MMFACGCKKTFPSLEELIAHEDRDHSITKGVFRCLICLHRHYRFPINVELYSEKKLYFHMQKYHQPILKDLKKTKKAFELDGGVPPAFDELLAYEKKKFAEHVPEFQWPVELEPSTDNISFDGRLGFPETGKLNVGIYLKLSHFFRALYFKTKQIENRKRTHEMPIVENEDSSKKLKLDKADAMIEATIALEKMGTTEQTGVVLSEINTVKVSCNLAAIKPEITLESMDITMEKPAANEEAEICGSQLVKLSCNISAKNPEVQMTTDVKLEKKDSDDKTEVVVRDIETVKISCNISMNNWDQQREKEDSQQLNSKSPLDQSAIDPSQEDADETGSSDGLQGKVKDQEDEYHVHQIIIQNGTKEKIMEVRCNGKRNDLDGDAFEADDDEFGREDGMPVLIPELSSAEEFQQNADDDKEDGTA